MRKEKIYYVYKFSGNPDPLGTAAKLKELFGEGYVFEEKYPDAEVKYGREGVRERFSKDMRGGGFTKMIVDVSFGFGRFMNEEIALAKEFGIEVVEVDLRDFGKEGMIK